MENKKLRTWKSNSIAEARGKMNTYMMDALDIALHGMLCEFLENREEDNLVYTLPGEILGELMQVDVDNRSRKFKAIQNAVLKYQPILELKEADGSEVSCLLFQSVKKTPKGELQIKVTEDLKNKALEEFRNNGRKNYYELRDTLAMKSVFAKRYYPVLLERVHKSGNDRMKFSGTGNLHGKKYDRIERIEDFKSLLGVTSNIRRTCETICEEINGNTGYSVEVEFNTIAEGRGHPKITHVCWQIEKKEKPVGQKKKYAKKQVTLEEKEYSSTEWAVISYLKEYMPGYTDRDYLDIAKEAAFDLDKVKKALSVMGKPETKVNPVGFIRKAIRDGYEPASPVKTVNKFNNFHQREYDEEFLESLVSKGLDE